MKSLSVEEKQKLVKFRYRVVTNPDSDYPYCIQKKRWYGWQTIEKCGGKDSMRNYLDRCIKNEYTRSPTVVFEYSNEDYLADKLKNVTLYHRLNNL